MIIEWFSFECRKTKTKVITLANHIGHRQYIEPIKTRSNYMWLTQSAGKSCERVTIGFGFTSDWMKRWRESFKPIASCRKCKTNYFSTLKWKPLYNESPPYGHLSDTVTLLLQPLFLPPGKIAIHFLVKKNLVNTAKFFGPLVTVSTGFPCNSYI